MYIGTWIKHSMKNLGFSRKLGGFLQEIKFQESFLWCVQYFYRVCTNKAFQKKIQSFQNSFFLWKLTEEI